MLLQEISVDFEADRSSGICSCNNSEMPEDIDVLPPAAAVGRPLQTKIFLLVIKSQPSDLHFILLLCNHTLS